jgi:hypothetical protein
MAILLNTILLTVAKEKLLRCTKELEWIVNKCEALDCIDGLQVVITDIEAYGERGIEHVRLSYLGPDGRKLQRTYRRDDFFAL